MAKNKQSESEPLTNFQDVEKTGRKDEGTTVHTVDGNKFMRNLKKALKKDAETTNDDGRPYRITEAAAKDGACHYAYEISRGTGIGDTHKVKGSAYYEDDLEKAFSKFNPHLAFIDDAFKRAGIEVTDITTLGGHELTMLYTATGFKIKGDSDSEAIVLTGNKYLSLGGRMEIETPKIPLDNFSSYKWFNELKEAADKAREEVALYKEGKCHVKEADEEEEKPDPRQGKLPMGEGDAKDSVLDSDFAEAAL